MRLDSNLSKYVLLNLLAVVVTFLIPRVVPEVLAAEKNYSGPGPFSVSV